MRPAARPSFAEVYDQHVWDVYGFLAYRLGRRDDAEDLTQVVFERAFAAWGRFDPARAAALTWLLAIARNALIDHWRADRSAVHEPFDADAGHGPVASGLPESALGLSAELEGALARLTDRERELLALRYGADLTGAQIAALTGDTLAAVQQALSRALRRMRAHLEDAAAA